jgi:hypothetical protein
MNYSLLLTHEALIDVEEAAQWYDSKQEKLGEEFSETALNYFEYLTRNAHSHPRVRGEYRELTMKRFPYVIIYRIIKEKEVLVLGIIHTKKHPSSRKKRK